jgi:hypothetical protein
MASIWLMRLSNVRRSETTWLRRFSRNGGRHFICDRDLWRSLEITNSFAIRRLEPWFRSNLETAEVHLWKSANWAANARSSIAMYFQLHRLWKMGDVGGLTPLREVKLQLTEVDRIFVHRSRVASPPNIQHFCFHLLSFLIHLNNTLRCVEKVSIPHPRQNRIRQRD